jgi:LacI family xylobiose transport system transcriptional regulator
MSGDLQPELLDPFLETGFPYVAIKRSLPGRSINCVVSDDVRDAFLATEHLIQLGHTRIGVIAPTNIAVGRDRTKGYFQALDAHGLKPNPAWVCYAENFFEETGYQCALELVQMRDRPTAVFALGDIVAIGAYRAIQEAGLCIPEDVAVVGHDDIPPAAEMSPPLTTMRTSYHEFGAAAVSLLLDILTRQVQPPKKVVVESSLVVRASSGRGSPA